MAIYGEKTVLSVPLRYGDERVGILRLYDMHEERAFTDAELQLARGLGEQAAIAIINARLFAQVDAAQRRLEALLDAGRALTSSLVLEEVIDTVTRTGAAALGSSRCLLYEYDCAGDTLTARAYSESSPTPGYADIGVPLPLAKMPGDRAILGSRAPVVEQLADRSVDKHTRAEMAHWGEFTALNVPLFFKDEALGILMFMETEAERHYGGGPRRTGLDRPAERAAVPAPGGAEHASRGAARVEPRDDRLIVGPADHRRHESRDHQPVERCRLQGRRAPARRGRRLRDLRRRGRAPLHLDAATRQGRCDRH
jgi:GAF domain-containing protein